MNTSLRFIDIIFLCAVIASLWALLTVLTSSGWQLLEDLLPERLILEPLSRFCASVRTERATLAPFYMERPLALQLRSVIGVLAPTFSRRSSAPRCSRRVGPEDTQ